MTWRDRHSVNLTAGEQRRSLASVGKANLLVNKQAFATQAELDPRAWVCAWLRQLWRRRHDGQGAAEIAVFNRGQRMGNIGVPMAGGGKLQPQQRRRQQGGDHGEPAEP